jgi:hypothetical protein
MNLSPPFPCNGPSHLIYYKNYIQEIGGEKVKLGTALEWTYHPHFHVMDIPN